MPIIDGKNIAIFWYMCASTEQKRELGLVDGIVYLSWVMVSLLALTKLKQQAK
jgi:hypothetical protein